MPSFLSTLSLSTIWQLLSFFARVFVCTGCHKHSLLQSSRSMKTIFFFGFQSSIDCPHYDLTEAHQYFKHSWANMGTKETQSRNREGEEEETSHRPKKKRRRECESARTDRECMVKRKKGKTNLMNNRKKVIERQTIGGRVWFVIVIWDCLPGPAGTEWIN